jgi:hypothetical protein
MGVLVQLKTVAIEDIPQSAKYAAFFSASAWATVAKDFGSQSRNGETL